MARQPLGRGLSALLGEDKTKVEPGNIDLDIHLIDPNPQQPRTRFAETDLEELAQSIRANGVVQPIVVRPKGARYEIVAGERRWRASQKAELHKIPAVVREVSDDKLLELALVENIQRQELNPIEEAKAYRKLIDNIGLTQEDVATRVGKSRTVVTTAMRLLKLPDQVQRNLEEGKLSAGHGRALLMTDDPKLQIALALAIVAKGLSVRETEQAVKKGVAPTLQMADSKAVSRTVDANVKAAETKLMRRLNTAVKILPGKKGVGGKIEIEYYSTDDLDRIYDVILGK